MAIQNGFICMDPECELCRQVEGNELCTDCDNHHWLEPVQDPDWHELASTVVRAQRLLNERIPEVV